MDPMYLPEVEAFVPKDPEMARAMAAMRAEGRTVPQIWHLIAWKPEATDLLARFSHIVMRGESVLSAGQRELMAAFVSRRNDCLF
ncbi:peroxidase [bacterium]|nr:peroxidase [bacterium]